MFLTQFPSLDNQELRDICDEWIKRVKHAKKAKRVSAAPPTVELQDKETEEEESQEPSSTQNEVFDMIQTYQPRPKLKAVIGTFLLLLCGLFMYALAFYLTGQGSVVGVEEMVTVTFQEIVIVAGTITAPPLYPPETLLPLPAEIIGWRGWL